MVRFIVVQNTNDAVYDVIKIEEDRGLAYLETRASFVEFQAARLWAQDLNDRVDER